MNPIRVFIPTKGRVNVQYTHDILSKTGVIEPIIVCPSDEAEAHLAKGRRVVPFDHDYLSQSLDHCIHQLAVGCNRIILMDDDLRFSCRISPDDWKLRMADPSDLVRLVEDIAANLGPEYPMIGVSARQNNNRMEDPHHALAMRQSQVHGIYVPFFKEHDIHPSDVVFKSDFYMTLRVLTAGKPNMVLTQFTVDQALQSNAPGGVSAYRTIDRMNEAAFALQNLFPDFVKIRDKTTKWRGLDATFKDVTIFWKRALEAGLARTRGGVDTPAVVGNDNPPAPAQQLREAL